MQSLGGNSQTGKVAKRFMTLAIFNGLLALFFSVPILVPPLCVATPPGQFGCKESMVTSWPGTWLFVAYFLFLIVGVMGALAWGLIYYYESTVLEKTEGIGFFNTLHPLLFELGVVGTTGMMAAIGFAGGNWIAHGGAIGVAAEVIRTTIIPPLSSDPNSVLYDMPPVVEAVFIALSVLAQFVGLYNIITLQKPSTSQ